MPPLAYELALPPQAASGLEPIDCLADIHLQKDFALTLGALQSYLENTPAQCIFLLGDLFDVWIGDDAISEPNSFESHAIAQIRQAIATKHVWFMRGNRDFLIGLDFAHASSMAILPDPTVITIAGERYLLSHGDALCSDDIPYQLFRSTVREPQWQAQFLQRPLAERRLFAAHIRNESEDRKRAQARDEYIDLNNEQTRLWLQKNHCDTLIHGHTHQPSTHDLGDGMQRIVLSDWDLHADPARADLLRWQNDGWQRQQFTLP